MHLLILLTSAAGAADLPFSTSGCDALPTLSEIRFTFNVEIAGELKASRSWTYRPRSGEVVGTWEGESITFIFGSPNGEAQTQLDSKFVNDSFWLVPTCHLAWATELDVGPVEEGTIPVAPVGEAPGRAPRVVVTYPDRGGYTPGDSYELYLGPAGEIVAWTHRSKLAPDHSLSATFEGYQSFGPLRIATEHRASDREFRLFFSDVAVQP